MIGPRTPSAATLLPRFLRKEGTVALRDTTQKIKDWSAVYQFVSDTLTPRAFRDQQRDLNAQTGCPSDCVISHQHLSSGLQAGLILSRLLMANDRQAAIVAAIMTTSGVKWVPGQADPTEGEV